MGSNAVRMVVDKVAQNIIDLQQPSAAYIQVERMLRDVQKMPAVKGPLQLNILEAAGLNADEVLIEFLNKSDNRYALEQHFDNVVTKINDTIVTQLGPLLDESGTPIGLAADDLRKILNDK